MDYIAASRTEGLRRQLGQKGCMQCNCKFPCTSMGLQASSHNITAGSVPQPLSDASSSLN
jgi:hypothetical protein